MHPKESGLERHCERQGVHPKESGPERHCERQGPHVIEGEGEEDNVEKH